MMTTLQIVLAIVGVVMIGSIVLYNIIQERRFRKESERMFSYKRDDIMLGESVRTEASQRRGDPRIQLAGDDEPADEARHAVAEADAPLLSRPQRDEDEDTAPTPFLTSLEPLGEIQAEPRFEPAPPAPATPPAKPATPVPTVAPTPEAAPVPTPVPGAAPAPAVAVHAPFPGEDEAEEAPAEAHAGQASGLDPDTEYVARLKFATPILSNFSRLLASLRRIGKPVRAFGKRAGGGWEALTSNPRYALEQIEFGIQLADRGGAISQDQLDVFCRALYEFSAEEGGAVTCGDKQDALRAARALDLFAMDVDVLIGLNVVSSDARPFTSEAIHKLAEEGKLSLENDGTYHARDGFGHVLFTLTNQADTPFPPDGRGLTTHGITLLFDVPRVADGLAVFDRMTRLGFDLAWRLEGRLVDDNGRPVSEDSLTRDRARLGEFYARMEARGIPAGGERALRLFI